MPLILSIYLLLIKGHFLLLYILSFFLLNWLGRFGFVRLSGEAAAAFNSIKRLLYEQATASTCHSVNNLFCTLLLNFFILEIFPVCLWTLVINAEIICENVQHYIYRFWDFHTLRLKVFTFSFCNFTSDY